MRHLLTDRQMMCARSAGVVMGAAAVLLPVVALACAVCWGSSADHPFSRGIYWGILFLMAMPFTIVGSIGGWLIYRYRHPSKGDVEKTVPSQQPSTTQLTHKESRD